jgi:hypothetical protein
MEPPIVIRFRWTVDELLRADDYQFRHICRPLIRFATHFIIAMVMLVGCGLALSGVSSFAGVSLIGVAMYWFVLRRYVRHWIVRRQFRKRPDRDAIVEWQITADTIRMQNCLGTAELSWQAFTKMVRTPSGVMLYQIDQIFHWLPRTGFANDSAFASFIELARSKIERQYEVA